MTRERGDIVVHGLMSRVQRARNNPADFYSFVMRSEETGAKVNCAPHQQVFLEFIEAHDFCVVRMPPGFGKTFGCVAITLRRLGEDNKARCLMLGAAEEQAEKPTSLCRDIIENRDGLFQGLRLVYPDLLPSQAPGVPWTSKKLTVQRPAGIRDPSIRAAGRDSQGTLGSRLTWAICDDLLNSENTATPEACKKTNAWFYQTILTRASVAGTRMVVMNTPYAKFTKAKDLTFELEEDRKWPTLTMTHDGFVYIRNTDWDSDLIRPSVTNSDIAAHRLTAHDSAAYGAALCIENEKGQMRPAPPTKDGKPHPDAVHFDLTEKIGLWPEQFPPSRMELIQSTTSPIAFAHNYEMRIRADGHGAPVELAWIESCKLLARALGVKKMASTYNGRGRVVIGVDLAFGENKSSNRSAIFTMVSFPRLKLPQSIDLGNGRVLTEVRAGTSRILRVEVGQWNSPELVRRVLATHSAFGGQVVVETNGAQKALKQWMQTENVSVPIHAHHTGSNKRDINFGVESVFTRFRNSAWLIPNENGVVEEPVAEWIDECVNFKREEHTGDLLMACWIAAERTRTLDLEGSDSPEESFDFNGLAASVAASIGAR
jgi:hypothetical protein